MSLGQKGDHESGKEAEAVHLQASDKHSLTSRVFPEPMGAGRPSEGVYDL